MIQTVLFFILFLASRAINAQELEGFLFDSDAPDHLITPLFAAGDNSAGRRLSAARHPNVSAADGDAKRVAAAGPAKGTRRIMVERACPDGLIPMTGSMCGRIDPTHSIVQQVDVRQIVRETSCPEGMTLERGRCQGLESVPSRQVCPPGTIMRNGECLTFSEPRRECPPGLRLVGNRCTATRIAPAQMVCPEGQILDEQKCSCLSYIPVPPVCPPGSRLVNPDGQCDQCEGRTPAALRCPQGMELSYATRQCCATDRSPATIVCPEGSILNEITKKCIVTTQPPPFCPKPFFFSDSGTDCIHPVSQVAAPCAPGFRLVNGQCESTERSEASPFCVEGSELEANNECVRLIPVPPTCPSGFHLTSPSRVVGDEGVCEKVVAKVPVCPPEAELVGTAQAARCKTTIPHELKMCCPPGFDLVGTQCRRIEELAPDLGCKGECFRVTVSRLAFACPSGTIFVDDPVQPKCISEQAELPSSCASSISPRCLEKLTQKSREAQQQGTLLKRISSNVTAASGTSPRISFRALQLNNCFPLPPCPGLQTIPAQPFCPDGGEIDGNKCLTRTPIVPEMRCRIGTLNTASGKCVRETVVPSKSECPPGTQRQGFQCLSFEFSVPQSICPAEAHLNAGGVCVVTADPIPLPPRAIKSPASYQCPVDQRLVGRECILSIRVPQAYECPSGAVPVDSLRYPSLSPSQCIRTTSVIVPPPVERKVRPSFVCPTESRLVGTTCICNRSVPAEDYCPVDGSFLAGSSGAAYCSHLAPAIVRPPRVISSAPKPVCEFPMRVQGNRCIEVEETQVTLVCPDTFDLEAGDKCVRRCAPTEVCPTGSSMGPQGCCRPVVVAPTVKIVEGCTHSVVPADCPDCPRNVESTCLA